jgi:hypothetical protein
VSPSPPNTNRERENLRIRGAKFKPLMNIRRVKEIGRDRVKMVPNGSREITNFQSLFLSVEISIVLNLIYILLTR